MGRKMMETLEEWKPREPTFPSFLGVITHILGCETFMFHGFWGPSGSSVLFFCATNSPSVVVSNIFDVHLYFAK